MSRACFGYSTDTEQWPIELNLDRLYKSLFI
jgi:hypothetical protein